MRQLRVGHIGWLFNDEGPDCKTVAWCDTNEEKLKSSASGHPDIALYTDYREMLEKADLDLVVISTPNFCHAEQSIAFLEAGCDVFLEKPMGVTREECDQIIAAWRRSGKNLAIDFELRISPFASRVKKILDTQEYGELRRIEFVHHRASWLEEGNGIWRTRTEQSGGLFLMEPIHEVDIFRFFAGEIASVQSTVGPNVLPQYKFQDNVCTHFFFESGVLGTMLTTHTLSAWNPDPASWGALGHDMTLIFTCTKGSILVDVINLRILVNRFEDYPPGSGGLRVIFDHVEDYGPGGAVSFFHDSSAMRRGFIRSCALGEAPVQDALDAWKSHIVCLAAEESAISDFRRVNVDYSISEK